MTDWRELLRRYIDHVTVCEGVDFIDTAIRTDLTDEDLEILRALKDGA